MFKILSWCNCYKKKITPKIKYGIPYTNSLIVSDLDEFFENVYYYYYYGGFRNISIKIICDCIMFGFIIHFIMFTVFFINWMDLFAHLSNAIGYTNSSNIQMNMNVNIDIINYISPLFYYEHFVSANVLYILLMLYYIMFIYKSLWKLNSFYKIKHVYKNKLRLKQSELEIISFDYVMELLISLQERENFCRVKDTITKYDIISRITRKENYLNALISHDILSFKILNIDLLSGYIYKQLYSKIMKFIFKPKDTEINKQLFHLNTFRLKLFTHIIMQFVFMLPEILFSVVLFLFQNMYHFQTKQNFVFTMWSYTSRMKFKNYNELRHNFENRMYKSYAVTEMFLQSYKDKSMDLFRKFFTIILGSVVVIFTIVSFINSNFSMVTIFGVNVIIILTYLMFILNYLNSSAIARNINSIYNYNEMLTILDDPFEHKLSLFQGVNNCLINIPNNWNRSKVYKNNKHINAVFKNGVEFLIYEVMSIILFPFLWIKVLFKSKQLVEFVRYYSTRVDGVGIVCSFSVLNSNLYRELNEKDNASIGVYDKRFRDGKFINSMLYYERFYLKDKEDLYLKDKKIFNEFVKENREGDVDDEIEMLDKEKNEKEKQKQMKVNTEECVFEVYYGNYAKKYIKDTNERTERKNVMKNIYYYTSTYLRINSEDIIQKMARERVNYVNVSTYNCI